jgi:hypothetical protein
MLFPSLFRYLINGIEHLTQFVFFTTDITRGVSHSRLAIYIKKYLEAKEKLWKLTYMTMENKNLPKIL